MGERRGTYRVLVRRPEGKRPFARPGRNGMVMKWILKKWDVGVWTGFIWLRIWAGGGHL